MPASFEHLVTAPSSYIKLVCVGANNLKSSTKNKLEVLRVELSIVNLNLFSLVSRKESGFTERANSNKLKVSPCNIPLV